MSKFDSSSEEKSDLSVANKRNLLLLDYTKDFKSFDIINYIRLFEKTITLDRSKISQIASISFPSASKAVDELSAGKKAESPDKAAQVNTDGVYPVIDTPVDRTSRSEVTLNKEYGYYMGISIGSSQLKVSLLNFCFEPHTYKEIHKMILKEEDQEPEEVQESEEDNKNKTPNATDEKPRFVEKGIKLQKKEHGFCIETPDNIIKLRNMLSKLVGHFVKRAEEGFPLLSIGIAFPGLINYESKKADQCYNRNMLNGASLEDLFCDDLLRRMEKLSINTFIEHNASAAATAEKHKLYESKNTIRYAMRKNSCVLFLSTGISCGVILDNELYRGASGGEIGHIQVPNLYLQKKIEMYMNTLVAPNKETTSEMAGETTGETVGESAGEMTVEMAAKIIADMAIKKAEDKAREEEQNIIKDDIKNSLMDSCSCGLKNCLEHRIRKDVFNCTFAEYVTTHTETLYKKLENSSDDTHMLADYITYAINSIQNTLGLELFILTGRIASLYRLFKLPLTVNQANRQMSFKNDGYDIVCSSYEQFAPSIGAAISAYFQSNNRRITWTDCDMSLIENDRKNDSSV